MSSSPRRRYALSPEQVIDAKEALKLLEGTGLTLAKVAHRALAGRHAVERVKLSAVADQFMLAQVRRGARGATVRWYENKLAPTLHALGERTLDDIMRADLITVANDMEVSAATRSSYFRAIRAVWRWAMAHEPPLAGVDITTGLPATARSNDEKVIGILSIEDAAKILKGAGPHRSALALMLFAGLRPQELWGIDKPPLRWKHINVAERIIRVPAEVAKTRKARILEGLPPAVWAWLQPRGPEDQVTNSSSQWVIRSAQLAAGFSEKVGGQMTVKRPWPHDGTRHSFATYALALTGDPGRVSLWLGHEGSPRMLYTHYRGLATKAEATRYFEISP